MFNIANGFMALGLLPLILGLIIKVDAYVLGWLIGTYPLIVVAFISGMQFQLDKNYLTQGVAVFLPVLCSLAILFYANAYIVYIVALILGLCVDARLFYCKRLSIDYMKLRLVLSLLFMVLLWELNQ